MVLRSPELLWHCGLLEGPRSSSNEEPLCHPASVTWQQQCAVGCSPQELTRYTTLIGGDLRFELAGVLGTWLPSDDSCAEPGDLTLSALPAKTCLCCPAWTLAGRTQIGRWMNVPRQDYGPKRTSAHHPGPRPWRVKASPWALALLNSNREFIHLM